MITAKIEKQGSQEFLTISLPVQRERSASGKSIVIASTRGNKTTDIKVEGQNVVIGVNAYIKA